MKPVVILRPEPGAGRTAERARPMGLDVRLCPLFRAQPLEWTPPPAADFDALLLTSAQAARHAGPALAHYRALPTYAVGAATAAALREQGFDAVTAGAGDGSAIAARIAADGHRAVLHLSGSVTAPMEAGPLRIRRLPVYRMENLSCDLAAAIGEGAVLMVHSARAGARLAEIVPQSARARASVAAIGPAALAACGAGWAAAASAESPDDDAMLALARRLCE